MRIINILLFVLTFTFSLNAQSTTEQIDLRTADSLNTEQITIKRPIRSLGLGVGSNLFFFGINRFMLNEDFSKINIHSIKKNLQTMPVWDSDKFFTNMFGHPYHGSHYFNAARVNGYSFYESIPFTFAGSLFWEYLMEIEPPSTNDLFATTLGGPAMGEVIFRLSDLIYDKRKSGSERLVRELIAGLLNPMYAVNRWLDGTYHHNPYSKGNILPVADFSGYISIGSRHYAESKTKTVHGASIRAGIEYGDIFDDEILRPYEWFLGDIQFDIIYRHFLLVSMNINGALRTWEMVDNSNWQLIGGFFQPYTYYRPKRPISSPDEPHPFYMTETAAVGTGLLLKNESGKFQMKNQFYANAIALGASTSDYSRIKNRDYNYGSGFSLKSLNSFKFASKLKINLDAEFHRLYTWLKYDESIDLNNMTHEEMLYINFQGDRSRASLFRLKASAEYMLRENISLLVERNQYIRKTIYHRYPNIKQSVFDDYIQLRYSF